MLRMYEVNQFVALGATRNWFRRSPDWPPRQQDAVWSQVSNRTRAKHGPIGKVAATPFCWFARS